MIETMDFTRPLKKDLCMNSIYTLILAYFSPMAQETKETKYGVSLVADNFQIEMDSQQISVWTPDENVYTIYSSRGNVQNPESALRIEDLVFMNKRFDTHQEAFEFIKSLFA